MIDWTEKSIQIEAWLQNNKTQTFMPANIAAFSAQFDLERLQLEKHLAETTEWASVFWDGNATTDPTDPLLTPEQWASVAYPGN